MDAHRPARPTWLLAHDFSTAAQSAAREAARDILRIDGGLVLLHVCPVPLPASYDWISADATTGWQRDVEATLVREASARLWDECSSLRRAFPDLRVEVLVRDGPPAETILQVARELKVDRVVVGTHGRKGLQHLLLGSVAERVARHAEVPVLVVKSRPIEPVDAHLHL